MIVIHQGLIGESLGEEDGVALIDESSVVKQGSESVGVSAGDAPVSESGLVIFNSRIHTPRPL